MREILISIKMTGIFQSRVPQEKSLFWKMDSLIKFADNQILSWCEMPL